MPLNGHNFDPYFRFARRGYGCASKLKGVTVESVTCECGYRPRPDSWDPERVYKAHLKKYHRNKWEELCGKEFVIHEEPDLEANLAPVSDKPTNIDTLYAVATGRKTYFQKSLDEYSKFQASIQDEANAAASPRESNPDDANLISSEVRPDVHMPVIDCDFGIQAVASTTPGHYHLYVDQELTWDQYKALLDGFFKAGLIQQGWYRNAMNDKRSYVRLPHVRKPNP